MHAPARHDATKFSTWWHRGGTQIINPCSLQGTATYGRTSLAGTAVRLYDKFYRNRTSVEWEMNHLPSSRFLVLHFNTWYNINTLVYDIAMYTWKFNLNHAWNHACTGTDVPVLSSTKYRSSRTKFTNLDLSTKCSSTCVKRPVIQSQTWPYRVCT